MICDGESIKGIHLPPTLQVSETASSGNPLSFTTAVENFEKDLIIDGLKKNNGNQTKTAEFLDTSLRIINYKIHQYNIDPKTVQNISLMSLLLHLCCAPCLLYPAQVLEEE